MLEKSLDDTNWESCDSFESSRPATQVLIDGRRISTDDSIIGLRLGEISNFVEIKNSSGPNRRRGGIIGEINLSRTSFQKSEIIEK